ncbi:unnamed protein product [Fusarium equiseti]|uniref:Uncharacterized protein n=1 Tax=Fusarium equiseti TaxID=61235 RepID=A0A8J2IU33_FUSEQ|nr:unnamed protein product [Fusarium equiseti]
MSTGQALETLSVIVSHRLGPTNVVAPTPGLVHLVSLQGIDETNFDEIAGKKYVLMTSLFSWTYTALPPGAPDVVSMLPYLGREGKCLTVLRTDMVNDPKTKDAPSKPTVEEMVTRRQHDGYNLVHHRVITGEQTAAMYRAALSRLRMLVDREALEKERQNILRNLRAPVFSEEGSSPVRTRLSVFSDQNPHTNYMSKQEIKSDIVDIAKALNGINETVHEKGYAFSLNRRRRCDPLSPFLEQRHDDFMSFVSEHICPRMPEAARYHMFENADTPAKKEPYNHHAIPSNTDYAVVQEWVLKKLRRIHQQTYISAFGLDEKEVKLQCKRIYATGADAPLPEPERETRKILLDSLTVPTSDLLDWEARTLEIEYYAGFIHEKLRKEMPRGEETYDASAPTSAVFSLQFDEPIYTLSVTAKKPKVLTKASQEELDPG